MIIEKIRKFIKNPNYYFLRLLCILIQPFYQKLIIPFKVKKLRKKNIIKVLFVVDELGSWKTENLYLKMFQHPRFSPQLLLLSEISAPYAYNLVKEYFEKKKYAYVTMEKGETILKKLHPDIIFYQKPYEGVIPQKYFFQHNLSALFCMVPYCFQNRNIPNRKRMFSNFIWQLYAENEMVFKENNYPQNMIVTGLSFMDDLRKDKTAYLDPWHEQQEKKKIIYAPHHTIYSKLPEYSTFFIYADFMLQMAEKYKDKVQWAFKPHPLLKYKLYKTWGIERTDNYYRQWGGMENCQIEEGEYMGLFKHSNAMIHDCGSFKLEYLYTGNPVMYLIKEDQKFDYPNWQTQKALELHYHAQSKEDIEEFIVNVIHEKDFLKTERDEFVRNYLTPPFGKTACENIMNAILGLEEYS